MIRLARYEPYFRKVIVDAAGQLYFLPLPRHLLSRIPGAIDLSDELRPKGALASPITCQIQVTNACNLKCAFCYAESGAVRHNELTATEIKQLLQQLRRFGVFRVEWVGGEALLRKDFWSLVEHAHQLNFTQNLLSNGTMIGRDPSTATQIKKYFRSIQISVDYVGEKYEAHSKMKGAFGKLVESIRRLKEVGVRFFTTSIIHEDNLGQVNEICSLVNQWQPISHRFGLKVREGRARDHASLGEYLQIVREAEGLVSAAQKEYPQTRIHFPADVVRKRSPLPPEFLVSPGGRTFLYIDCQGNAHAFPLASRAVGDVGLGNVRHTTLLDIWRSPKLTDLRSATYSNTGCHKDSSRLCAFWERQFVYTYTRDYLSQCPHAMYSDGQLFSGGGARNGANAATEDGAIRNLSLG